MGNLDFIGRIAEGKIQEAMEEGKFDNLPGRGKPIVFDEDPMTPPHLRMMNRILKNANVLPEWLQIYRDIEADRTQITDMKRRAARENQKWAAKLDGSYAVPGAARQYSAWYDASRAEYLKRLKGVNTAVLKFTLVAPSTAQPLATYKVDAEMAAYDEAVPSHLAGAERRP